MPFLCPEAHTGQVMLPRTQGFSERAETAPARLSYNLNKLRLDQLQEAIRSNQVSFPAQVPVFIKHAAGKQQCHIVLLYFVRGWSCDKIAKRYAVTRQHIWQLVSEWRRHAVTLGYLQAIPPLEVLQPLRAERPQAAIALA